MKSPLADSMNLKLSGVPAPVRKASMIVLALELEQLKQLNGYAGGGSWQAYRSEREAGTRPRWEDFCKHHAGITDISCRNYFRCGLVVMDRLRALPGTEPAAVLNALKQTPSALTDEQRQGAIDGMVRLVLKTPADWQSIWNAAKSAKSTAKEAPSQAPSSPQEDCQSSFQEIEKMALGLGLTPQNARRVATITAAERFSKLLVETWRKNHDLPG